MTTPPDHEPSARADDATADSAAMGTVRMAGRAVALLHLPGAQRFFYSMAAAALVIAALVLGRDLLIPVALAALLAFMLSPAVERMRRLGLPYRVSVALVCVALMAALATGGILVAQRLTQVVAELPVYQSNIQTKLRDLRRSSVQGPLFDSITRLKQIVTRELAETEQTSGSPPPTAPSPAGNITPVVTNAEPVGTNASPLVVRLPPPSALEELRGWGEWIMVPLTTVGFVLILVVFMLSASREMQDRLVRLIGGDMHRVTDALQEVSRRVSNYLTSQLLVNASYGVPMALGLWWIGVPGDFLWGVLAAVLRFVPYLGPLIAAMPPLILAFAVDPGWNMLLWCVALIALLELISNNVVEPLVYSNSTGISPVAVLVSASFWAVVWGPIGLVLATPLTVCLAVLSRHLRV